MPFHITLSNLKHIHEIRMEEMTFEGCDLFKSFDVMEC